MLVDVFLGGNRHPSGAKARVVDVMSQRRFQQPSHHSDDGARRVEFTTLFSRRVRKLADEIFIRGAEEIRKFEIFVTKTNLARMRDQLTKFQVADFALADLPGEIDVSRTPSSAMFSDSMPLRALFSVSPIFSWASLTKNSKPGLRRNPEGSATSLPDLIFRVLRSAL